VLQHGVLALGVLADEHHVNVLVASLHSGERLAVDHVHVEVQLVTQTHVARGNSTTQAASFNVA
jgi:hypothetical protein